jgi:hypothetical protein
VPFHVLPESGSSIFTVLLASPHGVDWNRKSMLRTNLVVQVTKLTSQARLWKSCGNSLISGHLLPEEIDFDLFGEKNMEPNEYR